MGKNKKLSKHSAWLIVGLDKKENKISGAFQNLFWRVKESNKGRKHLLPEEFIHY